MSGISILIWFFLLTGEQYSQHITRVYNYILIRTSQQSSSKFTPFELMYKRKARLPIEVSSQLSAGSGNDDMEVTDDEIDKHMKSMMEWTERIHEKVKGNIK